MYCIHVVNGYQCFVQRSVISTIKENLNFTSFFTCLSNMKLDKFLYKIYYDPENSASFSSVKKLYKIAKTKFSSVT